MKIEKITDNKIRIILSYEELDKKHCNAEMLISKSFQDQTFFLDILNRAEKELDFYTDNCKLLIEAFSNIDDFLVFTITKFSEEKDCFNKTNYKSKKPIVRKKEIQTTNHIYSFNNFDTFCDFSSYINSSKFIDINKLAKTISLYYYKNTYYLLILGIIDKKAYKSLDYIITEYGQNKSFNTDFIAKIKEHGKIIMKHNAFKTVNKYF